MLEMAQTFLANKTARKFLFIYMLIMHFLVFITIYRCILVYLPVMRDRKEESLRAKCCSMVVCMYVMFVLCL